MILRLGGTALTVFSFFNLNYDSVISQLAGPLEFKKKGTSDRLAEMHLIL